MSHYSKKDIQYNGQKFEDTKGVIRSLKFKDVQYNGQKFEDTKGSIGSHKSKKDAQYNGQKDEMTIIYKTLSRKLKNEQHKRH